MKRDNYVEHQEDVQQWYFQSEQPKLQTSQKHQHPTRSKTMVNEATTAPEEREFVFLRDEGKKTAPIFEQCEFIL